MKHQLGALAREDETLTEGCGTVDLPGKVDSLEGGSEVGNHTRHTEVQSLLGDVLETEGILDNFLERHKSLVLVGCASKLEGRMLSVDPTTGNRNGNLQPRI